jgi:hypothetical protein
MRRGVALAVFLLLAAAVALGVRGYMTPETMLYFMSFKWCY